MKRLLFFLFLIVVLCVAVVAGCAWYIQDSTKGRVYDRADTLPAREIGLVLGTSEYLRSGGENPYFKNRIAAAAKLYHMGKVKWLLVSGDNRTADYNEPKAMKDALVALHVPAEAIKEDYAGLRTLDSIVRAEKIFNAKHFTIISQREHDQRAILIAKHYGIDAIAYAADDVAFEYSRNAHLHEWLAQVKVILDLFVLHTAPKHLGPKVPIH
jgi:SanA protein